ncbi:MAG: hypothetical protein KBS66_05945, partial [Eubacterium sp.]|nr:hypothetical protein [Candidatus Colimonas fimequi]
MSVFYAPLIGLSCFALIILCILVHENARFDAETKKKFYGTYIVLMLCSVAEYLGFSLNGAATATIGIHAFAKCMDFILSPLVAVFFVRQIYDKAEWMKVMYGFIGVNAVIEIASMFTGWTFYIDSSNNYHHGPFYMIYTLIYIVCIIAVIASFIAYG